MSRFSKYRLATRFDAFQTERRLAIADGKLPAAYEQLYK
jgi:hypothetical protein